MANKKTSKKMTNEYTLPNHYRLPNPTTIEDLEMKWNHVIRFGEKVILAGHYYNGRNKPSYFCAVYEYLNDNEIHNCESELGIQTATEVIFEDEGHALLWGMTN